MPMPGVPNQSSRRAYGARLIEALATPIGIEVKLAIRKQLDILGNKIEKQRYRSKRSIENRDDLVREISEQPGIYWIETNMPVSEIIASIEKCTGKRKSTRKTRPNGVGYIKPSNGFEIIYIGTHDNIQSRLLEHIFNEGSSSTGKLSINLNCDLFSKFTWNVYFININDYPMRYALEAWWRLNIGWPKFCIR